MWTWLALSTAKEWSIVNKCGHNGKMRKCKTQTLHNIFYTRWVSNNIQCSGSWYGTMADNADSRVHKLEPFINTIYSQTLTLFAIHANKKQHLDTIHKNIIQMQHRMQNNDFDILLRSVQYSVKLQITKIHKNAPKLSVFCTRQVGCSNFHISAI